jgi:hypothetical protein
MRLPKRGTQDGARDRDDRRRGDAGAPLRVEALWAGQPHAQQPGAADKSRQAAHEPEHEGRSHAAHALEIGHAVPAHDDCGEQRGGTVADQEAGNPPITALRMDMGMSPG